MFTRIKETRHGEYLQIVETYRDGERVRQRMILYVGHYDSIDEALEHIPKVRRQLRARAARAFSDSRAKELRREADALDERLRALQALVRDHPDLVERDRKRAARRPGQVAIRNRARREQRQRERQAAADS